MESVRSQFYRDQLRSARAIALADAEGFQAIFHALELIGQQLLRKVDGLGAYKVKLAQVAHSSPLSADLASAWPEYHTSFSDLYEELRRSRNDAVHQGAHARNLTDHALNLTIILEDALMTDASTTSQFMVREVVEAKPWHPVSFVRQQMLKYAFSYLPIRYENSWKFIPEYSVARYLRGEASGIDRRRRLAAQVREAVEANELCLVPADIAFPETPIAKILESRSERPILVVDHSHDDVLIGLLTSSDLL